MAWPKMARDRRRRPSLVVWTAGVALYVGWALFQGQDANWDLQNYHDYSAYALLTWRYPLDVGPGAFQGYFNPLPYVIPYGLRHMLPPRLAAALLALLQATVVPLAWAIARSLLPPDRPGRAWVAALAALVGATGAMAMAEIGTSFADLMLASSVLGGLLALLHADEVEPGPGRTGRLLLSGALIGAAGGLKLTNLLFVPGLTAAALIGRPGGWRGAIRIAGSIGLGGAAGFLATGGAWAAYLWVNLGNPVFPALNTVFHSSSAALSNFQDVRFLPHGLIDALRYPWRVVRGEYPTAEIPFADSRVALAFALSVVLLARTAARSAKIGPALPVWRSLCFLAVSHAAWLKLFAIERYAIALEVLAGTMAVVLAARLASSRAALASASVAALLLLYSTRPADFGHRPWSDAFASALPAALQEPAAYVMVFYPDGYWASAFPAASRFYGVVPIGLATGGVLRQRILAGLRKPPGGRIRTLGADWPMEISTRDSLASFGLAPAAPCVRMRSLWWIDTIVCSVSKVGERTLAAADLVPGETVDFSRRGSGWIYLLAGWINASADGVGMAGTSASLVLDVGERATPLVLELAVSTPAATTVAVTAGRRHPVARTFPASSGSTLSVCLPAGAGPDDTVRIGLDVRDRSSFLLRTMRLRPPQPGECG